MSTKTGPGSVGAGSDPVAPTLFARQATGLVRAGKARDAFLYNVMWSGGALTLAFMFLLAPTLYPHANLLLTVLISALFGVGGAFLYAMLTRLMPRTGGDYVFVSRTLHPAVGFLANFSYIFWNMVVAGVYATYFATYSAGAFLRMLVGYGASTSLLSTAEWFSTDWGIFISGAGLTIIAASIFVLGGSRWFFRIQQWTFVLYILGAFALVIVVGLFTSHASFLSSFNEYAANLGAKGNAAAEVQKSAAQEGYAGGGYNFHDTLLAVSVGWFIFGFIFSSNYFAGEVKTGRRTQFFAIPGAVAVVLVLLVATILSFQGMAGHNFINQLGTANPEAYGFSGAPAYPEIAAIASGSPIIGGLIILGFVAGIIAWLPMTIMLASRCMLAWSFDKVMPEKLSEVDERTHSPIIAVIVVSLAFIASTAVYAFTEWLTTLTVLFPLTLTLIVVAISGIVLPYRRRELYESSGTARWIAGIPVLTLVGVVALLGFVAAAVVMLSDPNSGTNLTNNLNVVLVALGVFFIVGPAIYYISKFVRKRQGVDLDLAYSEIPPE